MESINASQFKTHFGAVLDQALATPIRIERRGRPATIMMPEDAYEDLIRKASQPSASTVSALERLGQWASDQSVDLGKAQGDERAQAILDKHGKHW